MFKSIGKAKHFIQNNNTSAACTQLNVRLKDDVILHNSHMHLHTTNTQRAHDHRQNPST